MPKILIAIPNDDKKFRRAATSLPNLKKLLRKQAEKYERYEWLIYTINTRMTLDVVCRIVNNSTKRLGQLAAKVQELSVNDATGRCTLRDVEL